MKKFSFIIYFLLSCSYAWADLSNRGRLDSHHGKYEFLIPLIILLGIGGIAIYLWGKDTWNKYKSSIFETIGGLFIGGCVLGGLYLIYSIYSNHSESASSYVETNSLTPSENSLPPGFVPLEQSRNVAETSRQSSTDPWASYPPVITDGSQMSTKQNDFLVAAILNPTYNLHDYYVAMDMTPQNTQFLPFDRYCRSKFIRERYTPSEFRSVYDNVNRAWNIFCSLKNTNFSDSEIIKYMYEYSPHDVMKPRIEEASNPTLIRNLKIIPLQCTSNNSPKIGIL